MLTFPRKNWYEIRHLAVTNAFANASAGEKLIARAIEYSESKNTEYLKTMTVAVQPYIDLYRKFNFTPLRRTLRLAWDLASLQRMEKGRVEFKDLSEGDADELEKLLVRAHLPYWDWWFEEQGGPGMARDWIRKSTI